MPSSEIVLIAAVIVLVAAVVLLLLARQRSNRLKSRFGPEYERTVSERGSRLRAEHDLEQRAKRVERLHIRPLPVRERDRLAAEWRADQARFVDDPAGAVTDADRLVQEVMKARGYPVSDFEQRVEDISVDHPHVVQNYRAARQLADRQRRGEASTEDLRKALVHYRALFEELLDVQEAMK